MNSAPRQILVHMDAGRRSADRLALARRLANEFGASLAALYAALPSFVGLPYAPELGPGVAESLQEIDDERRKIARVSFDSAIRQLPGPAATWAEAVEVALIAAFTEQALYADLLVLGQHDPDEPQTSDVPADFVSSVLLASGKPSLVLPYAGELPLRFDTIAIAWKETREAARAVSAAMPFLQRAKRVVILAWDEVPSPVQGHKLDLTAYLRLHKVQAEWLHGGAEPSHFGELLLSRASDVSADLLVMGCYGHTRAREWVLSGTSWTLLGSTTLPLLMAH